MSNSTIKHKRGDTFSYSAVVRETRSGPAMDITDWTITSMLRDGTGNLIAEADVTITDAAEGAYTVRAEDTSSWPAGYLQWDIQHEDAGGDIRSTETVLVKVIADVTYPEPA
jgi:hypothetical protein